MTNHCFSSNYTLNAVEVNVLFNTIFDYFVAVNITSSTAVTFFLKIKKPITNIHINPFFKHDGIFYKTFLHSYFNTAEEVDRLVL